MARSTSWLQAVKRVLVCGGRTNGWLVNGVFVLGAAGLVWAGWIHLHLYNEGYKNIATIGPLFLAQAVTSFVLAAGIVVLRRVWAALVGMAFVLSTIGGFIISVKVGLFGFQDSFTAGYAELALGVEIATSAVLLVAAGLALWRGLRPGEGAQRSQANKSSSGTGDPVVSLARTNASVENI